MKFTLWAIAEWLLTTTIVAGLLLFCLPLCLGSWAYRSLTRKAIE